MTALKCKCAVLIDTGKILAKGIGLSRRVFRFACGLMIIFIFNLLRCQI